MALCDWSISALGRGARALKRLATNAKWEARGNFWLGGGSLPFWDSNCWGELRELIGTFNLGDHGPF